MRPADRIQLIWFTLGYPVPAPQFPWLVQWLFQLGIVCARFLYLLLFQVLADPFLYHAADTAVIRLADHPARGLAERRRPCFMAALPGYFCGCMDRPIHWT